MFVIASLINPLSISQYILYLSILLGEEGAMGILYIISGIIGTWAFFILSQKIPQKPVLLLNHFSD